MKNLLILFLLFAFFSCSLYNEVEKNEPENRNEKQDDNMGYVSTSNEWEGREGHCVLSFNQKLWLLGGHNANYLNDIWCSTDGRIWTRITSAASWSGRRVFGAVVFQNKIYIAGGYGGGVDYRADVWSSSDGITWTQIQASATFGGRAGFSMVVFQEKMWIIAGWVNETDSVGVYSSSDGITWTLETDNPGWQGRRNHNCIVFQNKIWLIGGLRNTGGSPASVLCSDAWYTSDGINWSQAPANETVFQRARFGLVNFDNKMWVIGGLIQNDIIQWNSPDSAIDNVSNEIYYTENGITWHEVDYVEWDKRASLATIDYNNNVYIIGGSQSFVNRFFDDISSFF